MAQSLGDAISNGLTSGFQLATNYAAQRRAEERQASLDAVNAQQLARNNARQDSADQLSALNAQQDDLRRTEQARVDQGLPATQEDQARLVTQQRSLADARNKLLSKQSQVTLPEYHQFGADGLEKLKTGDVKALAPGQFTAATATALGRPATDAIRVDGKPSKIEQEAEDAIEGLHSQDYNRMYPGLNGLLVKELSTGVGQPSPHGGTIIKKVIQSVHADPRYGEDDPHVIPMLRVYVTGGTPLRGPLPEDAPKGATGYYDVPATEKRSTDPADPPKSIGLNDFQGYVQAKLKLVDLLNQPEGIQQFQADQQSVLDPRAYREAQASLDVKKKAPIRNSYNLRQGESRVNEVLDPNTGEVISTRITQGNDKEFAPRTSGVQNTINAIDDLDIPEADKDRLKKAAVTTAATKVKGGGLAGPGDGTPGLKAREATRKELKDKFDRAKVQADIDEKALDRFNQRFKDGPPGKTRNGGKDRADYDAQLADLTKSARDSATLVRNFNSQLNQPDAAPSLGSAASGVSKPAAGKTKDFSSLWN